MIDLRQAVLLLKELESNNAREWYQAHKAEIKKGLLDPGQAACDELRQILETECQTELTSKVYRMNRDLRFSKDKTPYNPHFRFSLWHTECDQQASVCFHFSVETTSLTMGVGLWDFGDKVDRFRNRCNELASRLTPEMRLSEPELKRVPTGISDAPELQEHYRRKGLTVWIDRVHEESGPLEFDSAKLRSLVPLYRWLDAL